MWRPVAIVVAIVVAGAAGACGSPPTTQPMAVDHPGPPPAPSHVPPPSASAPLVFRQIVLTTTHAHRTSFELVLVGNDHATLTEIDERADDVASLAAVAQAGWTRRSQRVYRGSRRGADLDLRADDAQPLPLHCEPEVMTVAAPTAQLVAASCTADAAWDAPPADKVEVLACTAPGQSSADADDDDRLLFAPAPGIELAHVTADCLRGGGLRRAR